MADASEWRTGTHWRGYAGKWSDLPGREVAGPSGLAESRRLVQIGIAKLVSEGGAVLLGATPPEAVLKGAGPAVVHRRRRWL